MRQKKSELITRCIFVVLCLVLSSCARDGKYTVVSSYYNVCLRGSEDVAGAASLRSAIDFAYGNISYNDTKIDVYIGNHPDIGSHVVTPSVGLGTRIKPVYDGIFKNNQYVYVYGYAVNKTFGEHNVKMPIYIRLQVRDTPQQRMAARSLGDRFELCPS